MFARAHKALRVACDSETVSLQGLVALSHAKFNSILVSYSNFSIKVLRSERGMKCIRELNPLRS